MEIKAIVEATVTDENGSVDVVSPGDGTYRIEFGLLGISPRPAAQMDGKWLRLVLEALDCMEPTDIQRDGDSPRIYVKPDGMLVEIAAEIRDDGQSTAERNSGRAGDRGRAREIAGFGRLQHHGIVAKRSDSIYFGIACIDCAILVTADWDTSGEDNRGERYSDCD